MALGDPTTLLGTWTFDRHVHDRHAGRDLVAHGRLVLVLESDGHVRWSETGVLRWDDHETPVSRTLLMERRDDGWVVLFEDGRDFHPWTPGAAVRHACGEDTYVGLVRNHESGCGWSVTWEVTGPRKDYTMVTTLLGVGVGQSSVPPASSSPTDVVTSGPVL